MSERLPAEYRDSSGRLICVFKKNIDYDQFQELIERLNLLFNFAILVKLDNGFSQRYWDVFVGGARICFHFDDMICDFEIISLDGAKSDDLARKLAIALD